MTVEEQIQEISQERHLGASQIADLCAKCYITFAEESDAKTPEEFWDQLYALSKKLVWAQPDMAPIFSLANHILSPIREEIVLAHSLEALRKSVKIHALAELNKTEEAQKKIALLGMSLIDDNDIILTHSHSSSVKNVLIKAHRAGKSFHVVVTESRPGLEGKMLARELGKQGIITTLIVEAAALGILERCQKVFVGADRLSEQYFVNKVGTRALALGAKELERDFFVVCDTSKFVPGRFGTFTRKQHPPEEVLDQRYPNVIVENPYFEVIPLSLVNVVVCEEGLLPPVGVREYLRETVHFPELLVQ